MSQHSIHSCSPSLKGVFPPPPKRVSLSLREESGPIFGESRCEGGGGTRPPSSKRFSIWLLVTSPLLYCTTDSCCCRISIFASSVFLPVDLLPLADDGRARVIGAKNANALLDMCTFLSGNCQETQFYTVYTVNVCCCCNKGPG